MRSTFFFLLCFSNALIQGEVVSAQEINSHLTCLKGWTFSPTFNYGKIFKHTVNFQPEIQNHSGGFELYVSKQTNGDAWWQSMHHFPSLGIAASYTYFGNNAVLGSAYSLFPALEIPLITLNHFQLHFRYGVGAAILTRRYDVITNPTNNVIATRLNNITTFQLSAHMKASPEISLMVGGSFTHWSTGDVRLPNLGVNIPAVNLALQYAPVPYAWENFHNNEIPPLSKKFLFNTRIGMGWHEIFVANGPVYKIYIAELMAGKMLTHWDKLSTGIELTYDEAMDVFTQHQEIYLSHRFAKSSSASMLLQNEFVFGNIGITAEWAYYFYRPVNGKGVYQKLGTQYYFFNFGKEKLNRISIGTYLNTYYFNANYVAFELGLQL